MVWNKQNLFFQGCEGLKSKIKVSVGPSLKALREAPSFLFLTTGGCMEKEMATHPSILAWRIPWTGAWWAAVHGAAKRRTRPRYRAQLCGSLKPLALRSSCLFLSFHDTLPVGLVSLYPCLLCMSTFLSPGKGTSHWITAHPNPLWPHLGWITSAHTLFPGEVSFT